MNTVPEQYGYVLLSATLMGVSCIFIGFLFPPKARLRIFTENYLKNNFGEQHERAFGAPIMKGGYPDTGNGYYSKNLSYEEWYQFNNAQRAHYNYVEWIAACLLFLIIGGLYFPITNALIGLGIVIFRFIYAAGYAAKGPRGRNIGGLGNDILVLTQLVFAIISSFYLIQGDSFTN